MDLVLYEMLFYELEPKTIIELGAYTGASALWMADRLNSLGIDGSVLAVDIDLSLVDDAAKSRPGVEFVEGDCNQIERLFKPQALAELPHPLILIDDAHVNIEGVYRHFHQHALQPGDYMIIEDTIPWIPGTFGSSDDSREWGDWKWQEIPVLFLRNTNRPTMLTATTRTSLVTTRRGIGTAL